MGARRDSQAGGQCDQSWGEFEEEESSGLERFGEGTDRKQASQEAPAVT